MLEVEIDVNCLVGEVFEAGWKVVGIGDEVGVLVVIDDDELETVVIDDDELETVVIVIFEDFTATTINAVKKNPRSILVTKTYVGNTTNTEF